jgi:hypothetical protein
MSKNSGDFRIFSPPLVIVHTVIVPCFLMQRRGIRYERETGDQCEDRTGEEQGKGACCLVILKIFLFGLFSSIQTSKS